MGLLHGVQLYAFRFLPFSAFLALTSATANPFSEASDWTAFRFRHAVLRDTWGDCSASTSSTTRSTTSITWPRGWIICRFLLIAWPAVSIGSSKMAGMIGCVASVGRTRAGNKEICEHKLGFICSMFYSKSFTSSTRTLFLYLRIIQTPILIKTFQNIFRFLLQFWQIGLVDLKLDHCSFLNNDGTIW